VADRTTRAPYPPDARLAQRAQAEPLARGVVVYASGGQASGAGDLILLGPPLASPHPRWTSRWETLGDASAAATRRVRPLCRAVPRLARRLPAARG
jgi:hypothetical protein